MKNIAARVTMTVLACTLICSAASGQPPFQRGGGPPGGPFGGEDREVLQQFDKDGSGWLDASERKAAREFMKENPGQRRGFGPPPGGFGPPGGGFGPPPGGFGPPNNDGPPPADNPGPTPQGNGPPGNGFGPPRGPGPDPAEIFKREDRNGDGAITPEEVADSPLAAR